MDQIVTLRVFVRVAETGSFTKAADGLQMPRATVSAAVQELEARLGTRLLQRTTRRVSLTQDGAAYYERCLRLLADLEEADTLFRPADAPPKGKLKIDVPGRLGRRVLVPALPDFFRRYPQIELELGVTDRPIDLIQEGVDCVVRVGELADSRLVARRLGELPVINCASPAYLAVHGVPQRIEDLERHIAVGFASPATGRIDLWEYRQAGVTHGLALRHSLVVNSAEAYVAAGVAGLGLIQVPAYDVREHLSTGELVPVLSEWAASPWPISVLYPHRRHLSQRVQVFVHWASELFRARLELRDAA